MKNKIIISISVPEETDHDFDKKSFAVSITEYRQQILNKRSTEFYLTVLIIKTII